MYHIKNDQRSIRSAETIYRALATLIKQQSFDSIKVSELVKEADIGRATFYRNFDRLEDVLRWRCDQIVDELIIYMVEYRLSQPSVVIIPLLKPLLRFFDLHSSVVELLIAANQIDILQIALQRKIEQTQPIFPMPDLPAEYLSYGPVLRSSVAVHILAHWVRRGKKEPPDAVADSIAKMALEMSGLGILF